MSKLDRILLSIAVAVGAPLAVALGNLSAADLHHPGQWVGALILGLASSGALLLHYWLQQSPIQLQSPIVRAPSYSTEPAPASQPAKNSQVAPVAPTPMALPDGWTPAPTSPEGTPVSAPPASASTGGTS